MSATIHPLPILPPVIREPSAASMLTPFVKALLDGFTKMLAEVALEKNVPIERVRVSGVPQSDETPGRLLVTVRVILPAAGALAYWDNAGDAIERWAAGLPATSALIILDQISLDVEWSKDASL